MKLSELTKIGVVAALIWVVLGLSFVVFSFTSGKNPYGPLSILHHVGFAFYMIIAGMYIRAMKPHLSFQFKEALRYGVTIGVVGSFIFMLAGFFYLKATWNTSFPIYVENMTDFFKAMESSGELEKVGEVSSSGLQDNIESLKSVSAWNIAFNDFSLKMIIALILSFIIAVLMRKSAPAIE